MYFFWDVIPISLIMWYHYISFKSQIPTTAEDEEDEEEISESALNESESALTSQRSESVASSVGSNVIANPVNQSMIMPESRQQIIFD